MVYFIRTIQDVDAELKYNIVVLIRVVLPLTKSHNYSKIKRVLVSFWYSVPIITFIFLIGPPLLGGGHHRENVRETQEIQRTP